MNLANSAIDDAPQLTQLVMALGFYIDRHVPGCNIVHHKAEAFQRAAHRHVKTAVKIANQQKHQQQPAHEQEHPLLITDKLLAKFSTYIGQRCVIELVGLVDFDSQLIIEFLPRYVVVRTLQQVLVQQGASRRQCVATHVALGLQQRTRRLIVNKGPINMLSVFRLQLVQPLQCILHIAEGVRTPGTCRQQIRTDRTSLR
ncbi:hypothetical protein D3C76_1314250 [compost metagenome]